MSVHMYPSLTATLETMSTSPHLHRYSKADHLLPLTLLTHTHVHCVVDIYPPTAVLVQLVLGCAVQCVHARRLHHHTTPTRVRVALVINMRG